MLAGDAEAHFQATDVTQWKPAFAAPYSGPHSLSADAAKSYSFTATAFLGLRVADQLEAYLNPELAQGVPFSDLTGLAGFTNGELARTSGSRPKLYRARIFARRTWNHGGEWQEVESDANQLRGRVREERTVVTVGNFAVGDIFDHNAYSHDARTQFLNWALVGHGAYDFAADARGYTYGVAVEHFGRGWAVRAGRFAQPREPNQQQLDGAWFRHYGDQVEVERSWNGAAGAGTARLLLFRNRVVLARYGDALRDPGQPPSLDAVRDHEHAKYGAGLNVEQAVGEHAGAFLRAMWADGRTETYAYTEADRSLSGGVLLKGAAWGRQPDSAGVALARNLLSREHREYLARGGLGFFLGDGRLAYRPEDILEAFYAWTPQRGLTFTVNFQRIAAPAYNGDRGPVRFFGARAHIEF